MLTILTTALRVGWRSGGPQLLALIVLAGLIDGAGTAMALPVLHLLLGGGPAHAIGQLGGLLAVTAGLFALRSLVARARDARVQRVQWQVLGELRGRLVRQLGAAPWPQVVRLDHARVASTIGTECQRLTGAAELFGRAAGAGAIVLVQLALAVALSPAFAALAALLTLLALVAIVVTQRALLVTGRSIVDANRALAAATTGLLGGMKAAMAQGIQGAFAGEFERVQYDLARQQQSYFATAARRRGVVLAIAAAAGAVLLLVGYGPLRLAPALLVTLFLIWIRLATPLLTIQAAVQSLWIARSSLEAVHALEHDLAAPLPRPSAPEPAPTGAIVLDDVGYRHPGGGGIAAATLRIEPHTIVGIAGASGEGKTTLLDLVAGLLSPQQGVVSVGGVPLQGGALAGWRTTIAYVPQDDYLFNETLRRNLHWSDPAADDATILAALTLMGLEEVVARLGGLDVAIGERGGLLSGGERQRVALARALLRRPTVLLLDEATGALDVATEARVLGALRTLAALPTILLVSHRAQTLAACDRVVTVAGGRVD